MVLVIALCLFVFFTELYAHGEGCTKKLAESYCALSMLNQLFSNNVIGAYERPKELLLIRFRFQVASKVFKFCERKMPH